ncbi:MAG: phosphopantothenoylcysteine decarboxylase [Candidatus Omnitrophota bacterium]
MGRHLRSQKILITAGPTWVPVDSVRVISNISSGSTGIAIAAQALSEGARVTLLLGPVSLPQDVLGTLSHLKVVRFRYFDDLREKLFSLLAKEEYDIIIHTAAVSDYAPRRVTRGKISSRATALTIALRRTPKLIEMIRAKARRAFLVAFKLESGVSRRALIARARAGMRNAGADAVVANLLEDIQGSAHVAEIIGADGQVVSVRSKRELARKLFRVIAAAGAA